MSHLENSHRVPGFPGLGARAYNPVLDGQLGGGLNECVDAAGIAFEHGACVRAHDFEVGFCTCPEPEPPHQLVLLDARRPCYFGPSSQGPPPVPVHVPKPVLSRYESLCKESVVQRGSLDVGDAPPVSIDGDRTIQPGKVERAGQVGQYGVKVFRPDFGCA